MVNFTKVLQYGSEKADQYLLRMYNQSKDIAGSFCAKASADDGTKEGLAARAARTVKGVGLELACRAERAAAFVLLTVALLPQLFFLPITFAVSIVHSIKGSFVSRFAQAYFTLMYKELCVLGELLPSMVTPAFKPTFIPANAFSLMKMVKPKERYQIAASLAWRSTYALYKQAKLLQSGSGVPGDLYKAREIFKQLAANGYAKAHYQLGLSYKYANIFSQNLEKAFKHLKIASDKGLGKASRNLAGGFQHQFFKPSGENNMYAMYERGAKQGNLSAQYNHACILAKDSDKEKARMGIRQLEEMTAWDTQEAVFAAESLVSLYDSGTALINPAEPASEAKALYWAKKLLNEELSLKKQPDLNAYQKTSGARCVAKIFEKRLEKIATNPRAYEAEWPKMIADLKKADIDSVACYLLGRIYYEGILVKADLKEAEHYLAKVSLHYNKFLEAKELLQKVRHPIAAKVPFANKFLK